MTLNSIKNIDFGDTSTMDHAWYAHFQDHIEILQAIERQKNIKMVQYNIFPFNKAGLDIILEAHQQYHNDMNSVLEKNGTDLQELDIKDKKTVAVWANENFYEHYAARQALGI